MDSPANIVIKGTRDSDDELVTITLMVDAAEMAKPQPEPMQVGGSVSFGEQQQGWGRPRGHMLDGKLSLAKAGTTAGEAIEGKIDLRIIDMRGGMMGRFRGGGRGGRDRGDRDGGGRGRESRGGPDRGERERGGGRPVRPD